ncbi:MAG: GAF domain-containing protein, partial [Gemmatimonadaceae bacterium]|nr:GAF domain-containing protein [Gemmatimonadaceae bacterium]
MDGDEADAPSLVGEPPALSATLGSFERYFEQLPAAFAVTRGERHTVVYANAAFRRLLTVDGGLSAGVPLGDAFSTQDANILLPILDRAFRTGVVSRNRSIQPADDRTENLKCTVWPDVTSDGKPDHLLIELRPATPGEMNVALQRQVAERLLLSALREHDAAALAHASWRGAEFLATETRRVGASLDEVLTLSAMKRMSLPRLGAWCIVDTLDNRDTMHRLAIIHPDPAKQEMLQALERRWIPEPNDEFGLPAVMRSGEPAVVVNDGEAALGGAGHDALIGQAVRAIGVGPLLTVPLTIGERLIGAITFVGDRHGRHVTPKDIELARELAGQSARALERAREHGDAVALRKRAESASEAKSAFLGMISHELRTPLSAIAGYVDLLELEIRGPITDAQRVDLGRIRVNQRYLTTLINELLNMTAIGSGRMAYELADIRASDLLAKCGGMLEPLIANRGLILDGITCERSVVARADPEKVTQIVVNLLSNSIKFTSFGGHIRLEGAMTADAVELRVIDTGAGIPSDKLESIFEPFVQMRKGLTGTDAGIGLGLGISRGLARAM